jgi:hypothetical protein
MVGSECYNKPKAIGSGMDDCKRNRLERLASRYIWWTPPERTVTENLPRLVAAVMEMGTWDDAHELRSIVGDRAIAEVLDAPPAGVLSARSLAFWHARLGRAGDPPLPAKRFR